MTRKGLPVDARRAPRSTCKVCWRSIYADDIIEWVVTPNPGLAHHTCARPKTNRLL